MGIETKEQKKKDRERIDAVLQILKKQGPLSMKQEKFLNDACVERFLKGKGESVKKAAKHLRAVLSWRDSIGAEHLIADEFSAELADGVAYMAGHDDDARPVMVFRIKQDYPKFHSQKSFVRLVVFTLEVAISSMSKFVDQFVLLFDASFFRSGSAFLNLFIGLLKLISDYYPGRLYKAFVIDPPSLFPLLWKGVRPFVELWAVTTVVASLDFEDSLEETSFIMSYPKTASLRFDTTAKTGGGSTSSRFSFTVSGRLDSLKPWYLNTVVESPTTTTAASPSLIGVSPLNARSFSFASPADRSSHRGVSKSIPSTPSSTVHPTNGRRHQQQQASPKPVRPQQHPRTPLPSFLQSPASLFSFKKEGGGGGGVHQGVRGRETFLPYLRFYRRPYDEMVYRSKMRPPLGGLISIVAPQLKQQQQRRCMAQQYHHYQRF